MPRAGSRGDKNGQASAAIRAVLPAALPGPGAWVIWRRGPLSRKISIQGCIHCFYWVFSSLPLLHITVIE
jgi:hypothetical protein